MSDPDPTIPEGGEPAAPPAASPPPAMAAAGAGAGAGAAAGAAAVPSPLTARWTALGANERLALIGSGLMIGSYLLGVILARWSLGLSHLLLIVGAIVAAGVVLAGRSAIGAPIRAAVLRVSAAIGLAYAAIDVGDMLGDLDDWSPFEMLLAVATLIGAGILLVAAWRLTGGNVARDAAGLASPGGRSLGDRLVLLGGVAVVVAWVLLRFDGFAFREQDVIAVLAAVLAVAVLWLARGSAGALRWPAPATVIVAGLAVIVALVALNWFTRVSDEFDEFTIVSWIAFALHLAAAAVLIVGAALGWQARRTPSAAA